MTDQKTHILATVTHYLTSLHLQAIVTHDFSASNNHVSAWKTRDKKAQATLKKALKLSGIEAEIGEPQTGCYTVRIRLDQPNLDNNLTKLDGYAYLNERMQDRSTADSGISDKDDHVTRHRYKFCNGLTKGDEGRS